MNEWGNWKQHKALHVCIQEQLMCLQVPLKDNFQEGFQGLDYIISLLLFKGRRRFSSCHRRGTACLAPWCGKGMKKGPWRKFLGMPSQSPGGERAVLGSCAAEILTLGAAGVAGSLQKALAEVREWSSLFWQEMPEHAPVGNYFCNTSSRQVLTPLIGLRELKFPQVMNESVWAGCYNPQCNMKLHCHRKSHKQTESTPA